MAKLFSTPVVYDVPRVLPGTRGVARRAGRWMNPLPRGRSVVRISGTYTTVDNPTSGQLEAAGNRDGIDFFLGGHIYTISDAVAAALTAAGYGPYITGEATWDTAATYTWDELANFSWQEID